MPPKPTGFITLPGKIFAKSQKAKKFSTFRIFRIFRTFRLFDFSIFSNFSTFRAEISWHVNFSTFRLFEGEHRDFHGVTDTSQKSTQREAPIFWHGQACLWTWSDMLTCYRSCFWLLETMWFMFLMFWNLVLLCSYIHVRLIIDHVSIHEHDARYLQLSDCCWNYIYNLYI